MLRSIAQRIEADEGPGAVAAAIDAAVERLIAFEIQLGPFAVAQLRILAELVGTDGPSAPRHRSGCSSPTLWGIPTSSRSGFRPSGADRRVAKAGERIKRQEPITVVIGNPPYKEKAKGRGGWIESGSPDAGRPAPLAAWMPPREWGVGAHAKHLRNLYVYFWRWATWKVFDLDAEEQHGNRLFHFCGRFPEWARLSKNARLPPPYVRRDLGHRLFPGGPPARSQHADLSGCAAAGLHRAGLAVVQVPSGKPGESPLSFPCGRTSAGEVQGTCASLKLTSKGWINVLDRLARSVLAGPDWGVVRLPGLGRPVHL